MKVCFAEEHWPPCRCFIAASFVKRAARVRQRIGVAPRARARTLSSRGVGRKKGYLRYPGLRRLRADGMRVHEGMGRVTAPRPPDKESFHHVIATCATRNPKREAKT